MTLLLLLLLSLASCMPDSLDKFKEDSPVKDVLGGSAGGTVTPSDGTISSISITQEAGDTLIIEVDNIDSFTIGDTINVSSLAVSSLGTDAVGTVSAVTSDGFGFYLAVTLGAAATIPGLFFDINYFIDNCSTGYASCGASVGAAQVVGYAFYIGQSSSFSKIFNTVASSSTMDLYYL